MYFISVALGELELKKKIHVELPIRAWAGLEVCRLVVFELFSFWRQTLYGKSATSDWVDFGMEERSMSDLLAELKSHKGKMHRSEQIYLEIKTIYNSI